MPRVLIADDHPPTRAGVRAVLEEAGFEVCAEAADAAEAVTLAAATSPDVCLLDIRMPRGGGIAAADAIARAHPGCALVMLTVSRDDDDLFAALQAGAIGYLLKDGRREDLPAALERIMRGEAQLSPTLVVRLIEEFRSRGRRRRAILRERPGVELRKREWEVLELLHEGLSTSEVASRLFISEVTVRSHVSTILRKLRVRDRAEAVALLDAAPPE